MLLVIDVEDAGFAKLPCGCRIYDIKVFDKETELSGVYRVEAHRRSPLEMAHGKGEGYWAVMQIAEDEKGRTIVHNGRVMKTEFSSRDIELRCKHWGMDLETER